MAATHVKGTNYTLAEATDRPSNAIPRGEKNAPAKIAIDTYTTAALEVGSTIKMLDVPVNAYLTSLVLQHNGLASSSTVALGDGTTADKYLAAASTQTAGILTANAGLNTVLTSGCVTLTTGGATLTADKTITAIATYVEKLV